MIAKKCSKIMEDGFRCNRPFSDRTGSVQHKMCEEHRTRKDKKTGLIKDTSNNRTGNPYLKAANAKLMEEWVITQMGEMPELVAKIEELETKILEAEQGGVPGIGSSSESKNRFLTSNLFKSAIEAQVGLAVMKVITEDKTFNSKIMGTVAKLNGRMKENIVKMVEIEMSVSPRITELSQKLDRMERLMETVEVQQAELSAMLKHEKRKLKKRMHRRATYVPVGEKENEEE